MSNHLHLAYLIFFFSFPLFQINNIIISVWYLKWIYFYTVASKNVEKPEVIIPVENFFDKTPIKQKKEKPALSFESNKSNKQEKKQLSNTNDEDKNCELKPGKIDSQSTTPKKEHGKSKKTKDNVSSNEIFDEKKMGKISEESSVITKKQEKNGSNTSIVVSKKQNSAAYQKYLQRSGPKNPNSKTIPKV